MTALVLVSLLSLACCALQQAPAAATAPAHLRLGQRHRRLQQQHQLQQQQHARVRQLQGLDVWGCEGSWAAAPGGITTAAAAAAAAGASSPATAVSTTAAAAAAAAGGNIDEGYMNLAQLIPARAAHRRRNRRPSSSSSSGSGGSAVISEASISNAVAVTAASGPSAMADTAAAAAATDTVSSSSSDAVNPASICSGDPPLAQTTASRTLCRLFVNSLDKRTFLCSAWFVTPKHLVTAGMLVMTGTMCVFCMFPNCQCWLHCQQQRDMSTS
jgi:hypothetical protein